jgi:hypothetical protein
VSLVQKALYPFRRIQNLPIRDDAGLATAEYAMTTVAACGFAGVLYKVLTMNSMQELIADLIRKAFSLIF